MPLEYQKRAALVIWQGMNSLGSWALNHLGFFWLQVTESRVCISLIREKKRKEKDKGVCLGWLYGLVTDVAFGSGEDGLHHVLENPGGPSLFFWVGLIVMYSLPSCLRGYCQHLENTHF